MDNTLVIFVIFVMPVIVGAVVGYITSRPSSTPTAIRKEPRFGKV
jgi:hypothetical protein